MAPRFGRVMHAAAEGATVSIRSFPVGWNQKAEAELLQVVRRLGHLEVAEATAFQFEDLIEHPDEPLLQELFRGFVLKLDATLTRSLERAVTAVVERAEADGPVGRAEQLEDIC